MLPLIVFLLVIMSGSFFCAARYSKRFEETLISTIIVYILFTFLMGMVGLLRFAVYGVLIFSLVFYVLGIMELVKNKEWKRFLGCFFTPGFVILVVMCVVFLMGIRGKVFTDSDEFSHWGDVVKVMVQTGNFGSHPDSGSIFKSYPPGVSIFQYLFECIGAIFAGEEFVEWYCYFALNVLCVACVLPAMRNIAFRNVSGLFVIVVATVGLPYLYFIPSYITLYVEPLLAFMFAGMLLDLLWNNEKDVFFDIRFILMISLLVLAKDTGMLFGVFFLAAYIVIKLDGSLKNISRENIIITVCGAVALFLPKILWALNNSLNHVKKSFENSFDFVSLINVLTGNELSYRRKVMGNYIEELSYGYKQLGETNIYFNYIVIALVLLALLSAMVYLAIRKCGVSKKKAVVVEIAGYSLFVVYIAGLMITYMYKFSEFEAVELASFSRYALIVYLGLSLFAVYGFVIYFSKVYGGNRTFNLVILAVTVMCTPLESVITFCSGSYVTASISQREEIQGFADFTLNSIEDDSKVWFIYENGSLETRGAYKYCVRPNVVDGDVSVRVNIINEEDDSAIYSADEWMDELISNDYDYVAFYHIDDQFVEEYSPVFENPEEIVEDSIYAVDKEAKKLCLVALW